MATKKAYQVSFKIGATYCTNIAMAECEAYVRGEYAKHEIVSIRQAADHEIEALRMRGCPVIECEHVPTTAENNIRALEMLVEELREEFNNAIVQYEAAVEDPVFYDLEASRQEMERAERNYKAAQDDLELEIMWMEWDATA